MRRFALLGLLPLFALTAILTSTTNAHAEPVIGVDLDLGTAFQRQIDLSLGAGGRFGYRFHFPVTSFFLQPELGGHYTSFGRGNDLAYFDHAGTAFGGLRLGFGRFVQPNFFVHLGVGFVGESRLGPAADIGGALDFSITRLFSLGVQAAYNTVTITESGDAAKWVSFGLNLGFHLDTGPERRQRR
jgi:hypothetical protein